MWIGCFILGIEKRVRRCGSFLSSGAMVYNYGVAPITGAWVETWPPRALPCAPKVAPITGAWVETACLRSLTSKTPCRAHHGRVG